MKLELNDRSVIEKRIGGAIRSTIAVKGPLGSNAAAASAAKRVYSELKATAREQAANRPNNP